MKAIILAGGMGIRLRPFTFSIPKPLLPIEDKPILEIIIKRLKKFGFRDLILAVGYKSKMIETYFGNGAQFGVNIRYLVEKKPSGTAGPLALLRDKFKIGKNESFLLMNGDIMTKLDFSKMLKYHQSKNFDITVGAKKIAEKKSYGFVDIEDGFLRQVTEKPALSRIINSGIYMIKSTALIEVARHKFFTMPELINKLIAKKRPVGAYLIKEYWLGLEELKHFEEIYNNKNIRKEFRKL